MSGEWRAMGDSEVKLRCYIYWKALQEIANADFRGNRSWESIVAYNALREGRNMDTKEPDSA
jgi:hypothetical protein